MVIDDNLQIIIDCLQIGLLGLVIAFGAYIWRLKFEVEGYRRYAVQQQKGISSYLWIGIVLVVAFILKLALAAQYGGYETDMNCFYSWSDMIYENGFGKFYFLDAFTDYPPGYMAILWVVEAISRLFNIETASVASRVMIKLVPILADLGAGFVLYKLAKRKFSEGSSCVIAGVYVISPVVLTDSVFTLCVLLVGYLCMEKKRIPAYFVFVIGAFIKPQTLIFAPILIWTIIEQVFLEDFSWKKFTSDLIGGLCAIGMFFVMALPFGLNKVLTQYVDTLGQYPYGSVNAYNLWGLLGYNWTDQSETISFFGLHIQLQAIGYVAILAAVALSGLAFYILKKKNDTSRYFVSMAIVICTMFIFSVRMHERYMFPAALLLLAAFVVKPTKQMWFTYAAFSFLQFMNVAHVYKHVSYYGVTSAPTGGIIGVTALLTIGTYGYLWYAMQAKSDILEFVDSIKANGRKNGRTYLSVRSEDEEVPGEEREKFAIRASQISHKMKKADWIVLGSIMLVYSIFAIYDLGSFSAPQTEWKSEVVGDEIVIDLGELRQVNMIYAFLGFYENRTLAVDFSEDGINYETAGDLRADSVFHWNKIKTADEEMDTYNLAKDYRYVRLTTRDDRTRIRELVILDPEGNLIEPASANGAEMLFDEQDCYEDPVTFRSGTYFDEIYHARTAQEMIEGVYCYENTHPPLGKWLISLGVRVFGMTPFGWRIVGVLFGIAMLPFMYVFARRLFDEKTWAAGALTALFAFDFMHFTQTRIATIDVYVTFFVIAMFYFMYRYTRLSFYDTPLRKTFIPLGLSAVMMGLGCASKWPAVYAGIGLAIVFFGTMLRRYREYRIAVANPTGYSSGIEHQHIIDVYKKYTLITLGFCVVFFIIIAGLIYLLSYIPFSDGTTDNIWTQMIHSQQNMFNYHANLEAEHPYSSTWYEWPLMIRPVYYFTQMTTDGLKQGISAFGNPLVWWETIPVCIYMLYRIIRYSDGKSGFLMISFAAQYVPWMLVKRCTFMYHFFPSVPFIAMMIVYVMVILERRDARLRKWNFVYVGCAVLLFFMFYPVLAGEPANGNYIRDGLTWLNSWVLG